MEWKYDDDLCVGGTRETEIHVLLECNCYKPAKEKMDEDMGCTG